MSTPCSSLNFPGCDMFSLLVLGCYNLLSTQYLNSMSECNWLKDLRLNPIK